MYSNFVPLNKGRYATMEFEAVHKFFSGSTHFYLLMR